MKTIAKGFLVTSIAEVINGIYYHGVDTNAWPVGTCFSQKTATDLCELSNIDLSYPLLIDFNSAVQYYAECERQQKNVRLLYCEVSGCNSSMSLPNYYNHSDRFFLGFDYAYPSGDYYSAVANDVIFRNGSLSSKWRQHLNEYGLFQNAEQVQSFAQDRLAFLHNKSIDEHYYIERGNFSVFCIFRVNYQT